MRAVAIVLLFAALAAVQVCAQVHVQVHVAAPATAPAAAPTDLAIMSKPAAHLKKPLIFNPTPAVGRRGRRTDEPLIGAAPATLKKAVVTTNLFGNQVEFENATAPNGCPCQRIAAQKHRYDVQYKRQFPRRFLRDLMNGARGCGCGFNMTKPVDPLAALPPVIAQLKPLPLNITALVQHGPCNTTLTLGGPKPVEKIAPAYYNRRPAAQAQTHSLVVGVVPGQNGAPHTLVVHAAHAAPCLKNGTTTTPKVETIVPQFYGETRAQRLARRAERQAREMARLHRRAQRFSNL